MRIERRGQLNGAMGWFHEGKTHAGSVGVDIAIVERHIATGNEDATSKLSVRSFGDAQPLKNHRATRD